MSSADFGADRDFRAARVAKLGRTKRRVHPAAVGGVVVALLVAAFIAGRSAQPDDTLARRAANPGALKDTSNRQGGTHCVGWPVELTPTAKPKDRPDTITIWGNRAALSLRNNTSNTVTVDVSATGSSVRQVDSVGTVLSDSALRFEMEPGNEASFTAGCPASALTFVATDATGSSLGAGAFNLGSGPADAPLIITKVRRP